MPLEVPVAPAPLTGALAFTCCGSSGIESSFVYIPLFGYIQFIPHVMLPALAGVVLLSLLSMAVTYCCCSRCGAKVRRGLGWTTCVLVAAVAIGSQAWLSLAGPSVDFLKMVEEAIPDSFEDYRYLVNELRNGFDEERTGRMVWAASEVLGETDTFEQEGLDVVEILTPAEAAQVANTVVDRRRYWVHHTSHAGPLPFFTLGVGAYLDAPEMDEAAKATQVDILNRDFGWLFDRVMARLSEALGEPVELRDRKSSMPGFHIFLSNRIFRLPVARVHYDVRPTCWVGIVFFKRVAQKGWRALRREGKGASF